MTEWAFVKIGDVCKTTSGGTPNRSCHEHFGGQIPWVKSGDLNDGIVSDIEETITEIGLKNSSAKVLPSGTLVVAMYGATVGKLGILGVEAATNQAVCAITPSSRVDRNYLFYFLKSIRSQLVADSIGGAQPNISQSIIREINLPIPSIDEQRRIAAILDKADAIRRKHQQVLAQADDFLRSTFLGMFGDPLTNPKKWPIKSMVELLHRPLRNGVSPSSMGTHTGKVLTLSAITGRSFDSSCVKTSMFELPLSPGDAVQAGEFYICRGNGNPDLVGKGFFATASMEDTAFPDTMIAAQPDEAVVCREYFEVLWNSQAVRSQIAKAARTTNGTFKVNQTAIEGIQVIVPSKDTQDQFRRMSSKIGSLIKRSKEDLTEANTLFASLSQRAFRGEL